MAAASLTPPPRLTTARLVLRPARPDDAEALFAAYTADPEVARFMTWRPHRAVAETRDYLRACADRWAAGTGFTYLLEELDRAGPIGAIDLRLHEMSADFGYVLARAAWGRGLMPEALRALADWALAQPGIWRAVATCDVENRASARVMEKAGMRCEGVLRRHTIHPNLQPEPRDCRLYARTKDD
ncbi:GNAT family N-acetyltransferase [Methylobacterium indicum]|uniref:Alanine acetyltransferase n=1 Tax=Methylobacterium indicum TaxID=1775910 RepID=A0A8H9C566_9HYPH|nr:GNAT family N-acetyltransferase [Methylobacterium indicum]BCM84152.1 alanine acetyltransferase [Methylobacterium indicum]